jgi:glycosyltransferase involved in cell wall biosynthesis
MRIALAHEFLTQFGGAERVLQNFLAVWPDADLHVLVHNPDKIGHVFDAARIKTSFVNRLPLAQADHKWYLALMPRAIESFDFSGYDLVLSDSSSFAKGVRTDRPHVCYCHTPTRFLWTEQDDYLANTKYPFFIKWLARPVLSWIRQWDYRAAQRPNYYIANSRNVQARIRKYYDRDSEVIPPPVDTVFFHPVGEKQDYFLVASRLEPYKKVELAIEAFNELGWPLKVAGTGTAAERLKKVAGPNVEFLGQVSDERLRELYSGARAYVFTADEDAGIMPLEAQACGTAVIAYGAGGSLETVVPGVTGEFFQRQDKASLVNALNNFNPGRYSPDGIRRHAQAFDSSVFRTKIKAFVEGKIT